MLGGMEWLIVALLIAAVGLLAVNAVLLRRAVFLIRMNTEITAQAGGLGALAFADARTRMRAEDSAGGAYDR